MKGRRESKVNKQKTSNGMLHPNTTTALILLAINQTFQLKGRVIKIDFKKLDLTIYCIQDMHFIFKNTEINNCMEENIPCKQQV